MKRAILGVAAAVISFSAAKAITPPQPPGAESAYGPSAARYVSIDGRYVFSVNPNTAQFAHVTPAKSIAPGAPVPMDLPPYGEEFGIAAHCGDATTACLQFAGYAFGLSRAVKPAVGATWQAAKWRFEVVSCLFKASTGCRLHLVRFEGEKSSGWFWWSPDRGVEAFGRAGSEGELATAYMLVSVQGLLK